MASGFKKIVASVKKKMSGRSGSSVEKTSGPSASSVEQTSGPSNAPRSALNELWTATTGNFRVPLGVVRCWKLEGREKPVAFTTAEFYGCTIVLIADANHALIGHFHEERESSASGLNSADPVMEDARKVRHFILDKLVAELDLHWDLNSTCRAWIIHSSRRSTGYNLIRDELVDQGMLGDRIREYTYTSGAGTGEFENSPRGKAVLQWPRPSATGDGTLNVYIQKDQPTVYNINRNVNGELVLL